MADESAQLGIQQEINKVLQERQAIMAASAKQLQDQTQIAMQLCAALKCESLDGMVEKLEFKPEEEAVDPEVVED